MPSSATITTFVTMVAGTKARASHVNTNFDNYRGHVLPINTDTATASHQTHDLGASDHHWRRIYLKEAPLINGSALGKLQIQAIHDASSPCDLLEDDNWLNRTSFNADDTTGVAFEFVVPDEYVVGNRISISLRGYCDTGGTHFVMESGSALFKDNVTNASLTAPSNVLTSTSNILPPTTTALMFTNTSLRITDASGRINSVTVTSGDVIACYLNRTPSATADTNTGYYHLTNIFIDLNN